MQFNSSYGKMAHSVLTGMSKLPLKWIEKINIWFYFCWSLKAAAGGGCECASVLLPWCIFRPAKLDAPLNTESLPQLCARVIVALCTLYKPSRGFYLFFSPFLFQKVPCVRAHGSSMRLGRAELPRLCGRGTSRCVSRDNISEAAQWL